MPDEKPFRATVTFTGESARMLRALLERGLDGTNAQALLEGLVLAELRRRPRRERPEASKGPARRAGDLARARGEPQTEGGVDERSDPRPVAAPPVAATVEELDAVDDVAAAAEQSACSSAGDVLATVEELRERARAADQGARASTRDGAQTVEGFASRARSRRGHGFGRPIGAHGGIK